MRFGHVACVGLAVLALVCVTLAGPVGVDRYAGTDFPFSSGFLVHAVDGTAMSRYLYCTNGSGGRGVATFTGPEISENPDDALGSSVAVSSTDARVAYRWTRYSGISTSVDVVAISSNDIRVLRSLPVTNTFFEGASSVDFLPTWLRSDGSDVVCFRLGRYAAFILDSDGDGIADSFLDADHNGVEDALRFGELRFVAADGTGGVWAAVSEPAGPNMAPRPVIYRIGDTNGDAIPDRVAWPDDPNARYQVPQLGVGSGDCAYDRGSQVFYLGISDSFFDALDVDGDGNLISSSLRPYGRPQGDPGTLRFAFDTMNPSVLNDGVVLADCNVEDVSTSLRYDGLYALDDVDFSGQPDIFYSAYGELEPVLLSDQFEPVVGLNPASVPGLSALPSHVDGSHYIEFADFGIWPDGRAFSFRQAGVERTSVDVSANGLLSFVGPITASPSLASLDATPGLVAPAWSDQWDTSQVRVFAGCAPVQRRFADGSGSAALSFVVEWRGLISPNGKRTNLRCLLLEDGSFRVDYGAMEIGYMPIVVGYSTDGSATIVSDDLSDNSWGGSPAGTLDECAFGEEFGVAKPFDLAHKWIRFAGYGDVRGPRPELISVVLKKGNKIQMKAAGSNIQPGAMLVVDGTETFELAKSATGSKWVVTKKVISTPGSKSVATIWADGLPHSIIVVNPDGGRSDASSLQ